MWNHWQDQRRTMIAIVIDRLVRADRARRGDNIFAGVQIPIETREVAAGNVQPDPVAGLEDVRRCPQVDRVLIDLAGRNQRRLLRALSITSANNSVSKKTRV